MSKRNGSTWSAIQCISFIWISISYIYVKIDNEWCKYCHKQAQKKKTAQRGGVGGSEFTSVSILFQKERLHEIAEIRVLICRGI